ncbi:hypothetical protein V6N13_118017 [Hibiscus sabdariffa]
MVPSFYLDAMMRRWTIILSYRDEYPIFKSQAIRFQKTFASHCLFGIGNGFDIYDGSMRLSLTKKADRRKHCSEVTRMTLGTSTPYSVTIYVDEKKTDNFGMNHPQAA